MSQGGDSGGWGGLMAVVGITGLLWFHAWSKRGKTKTKVPSPVPEDDAKFDYDSQEAQALREEKQKKEVEDLREKQKQAEEEARKEAQAEFDRIANEALQKLARRQEFDKKSEQGAQKVMASDTDQKIADTIVNDTIKELDKARTELLDNLTDSITPIAIVKGVVKTLDHELKMVKHGLQAAKEAICLNTEGASKEWSEAKKENEERNKEAISLIRGFIPVVGQVDTAISVGKTLSSESEVVEKLSLLEARSANLHKAQSAQYAARKELLDHYASEHPELKSKVDQLDDQYQQLVARISNLKQQIEEETKASKQAILRSGNEEDFLIEMGLNKKLEELEQLQKQADRDRVALLKTCDNVVAEGNQMTKQKRAQDDSRDEYMESSTSESFKEWSDQTDKETEDFDDFNPDKGKSQDEMTAEEFQQWNKEYEEELKRE